MQFHERLYELRKGSGMTQNDLAEKLDVSRQAVSRWEMGTAKPDIDNLVALSELFGVSLDYLLKGQEALEAAPCESIPEEPAPVRVKKKRNWLLIWAVLTAVVWAAALAYLFWEIRFGNSLNAISPATVIVQFVNLAANAGILVFVIWLVTEKLKKK